MNVLKESQLADNNDGCTSAFHDQTDVADRANEKKIYRHRFIYSVHLCFSCLICGWVLAQIGSALLDLQLITTASFEQVSLYQTFYNVGYLSGSLLTAIIHEKVNRFLFQFFTLLGIGATLGAVPWCSIHIVMVTAHFIIGTGCGILDSRNISASVVCGSGNAFSSEETYFTTGCLIVVNAEMLMVWGNQGLSFMQAMHFSYALGGILSPVITAQFLSSRTTEVTSYDSVNETSLAAYNWSTIIPDVRVGNQTYFLGESRNLTTTESSRNQLNSTDDLTLPTTKIRLHIAYFISAALCATIAVLFLILFFLIDQTLLDGRQKTAKINPRSHLNRSMKVLISLTMGSMAAIYIGVEESFSGFLNAFCVTHFHWSAIMGSYATSVFYGSFGFGRLTAILWVKYVNPRKILWLFCASLVLIFTSLTIAGLFKVNFMIWLTSAVTGLTISIIFPTIYTWTEEKFFPVSGKVSGYFNFTSGIGGMVNPIIIGSLMDNYTPMWYCYILTGEAVLMCAVYILGDKLTKRVKAFHNPVINKELQSDVDKIVVESL